jgi:hypothetical protein
VYTELADTLLPKMQLINVTVGRTCKVALILSFKELKDSEVWVVDLTHFCVERQAWSREKKLTYAGEGRPCVRRQELRS